MVPKIHAKKSGLTRYRCIACSQEIILDENIVDNYGRIIALEKKGGHPHVCAPSNKDTKISSTSKERVCRDQDTQENSGSEGDVN